MQPRNRLSRVRAILSFWLCACALLFASGAMAGPPILQPPGSGHVPHPPLGSVPFPKPVTSVAAGYEHSLALLSDGTVWAWGQDVYGQLGNGAFTPYPGGPGGIATPVRVTGLLNDPTNSAVVALAGGGAHSLALKSNGTVWAWGLNSWGQLGTGTFTGTAVNGYVCVSTPVQVLGLPSQTDGRTIVAIAAGYWHSLALKSDGTVWAWGDNTYGELGNGTFAGTAIYSNTDYLLGTGIATPAQVLGPNGTGALTGIVAIAAGCYHNLALKSDGTVWAWGENSYGELGNGTFTSTTPYGLALPAQVSGLSSIIAIGGGFGFSSALKSNGTVWASGYNANGQLGNGTFTGNGPPGDRTDTFGQVIGLSGVLAISAGFEQTLAIHSDSTAWAWGNDQWGELGNGTFTTTGNLGIATPAEVIDLP